MAAPAPGGIPNWLLRQFTPSTKAYIRHVVRYQDVRYLASPWAEYYSLPVTGTTFTAATELAGGPLGGDTPFLKSELQVTRHVPLLPTVVLDLGLRAGGIVGLRGGATRILADDARWDDIRLNDRFFLNWRNVRGFRTLGPSTVTEAQRRGEKPPTRYRALGGNAVWAVTANLNFPFPLWPSNGVIAGHLFANAGNLALFENSGALKSWEKIRDFLFNPAVSVGAGIVAMRLPVLGPLPSGRLELNMAVPLNGGAVLGRDGTPTINPWTFDSIRWGLHWVSLS
jgi:outer membrane protein assembly factor BamA